MFVRLSHVKIIPNEIIVLQSQPKSKRPIKSRESEYQNIGDLMSELLRNSIPDSTVMTSDEDQFAMLRTILDWQPIVKFINMYSKNRKYH